MPTRNVVLTERHEKMIEELVSSGRYQNASEVLREGLRLIEQRQADFDAKLKALSEAAAVGWASIERGDYVQFDDFETLDRHLSAIADEVISDAQRDE